MCIRDRGSLSDPTLLSLNNGASGNPPRIPGIPPIASVPISQFLSGPGPIYSGIPINGNADPLSLDSGRAVTGGYAGNAMSEGIGFGDCGCEPIDPCAETFQTFSQSVGNDSCDIREEFSVPFAENGEAMQPFAVVTDLPGELDVETAESQEEILEGQTLDSIEAIPASGPATIEGDSESGDFEPGDVDGESRSDLGHAENLRKPSFLKRFANWLFVRQA